MVYFCAVHWKRPDGFVPASDDTLQLPFPSRKTPKCKSPEMKGHGTSVQDLNEFYTAVRRSGFTWLKKKVAAGRRLPSFFWRSHSQNGALEEIFCRLHININILIFCLMFPQQADLSALMKPSEELFNRQQAVRRLKVKSIWVFVLTLMHLLNSDASHLSLLVYHGSCLIQCSYQCYWDRVEGQNRRDATQSRGQRCAS